MKYNKLIFTGLILMFCVSCFSQSLTVQSEYQKIDRLIGMFSIYSVEAKKAGDELSRLIKTRRENKSEKGIDEKISLICSELISHLDKVQSQKMRDKLESGLVNIQKISENSTTSSGVQSVVRRNSRIFRKKQKSKTGYSLDINKITGNQIQDSKTENISMESGLTQQNTQMDFFSWLRKILNKNNKDPQGATLINPADQSQISGNTINFQWQSVNNAAIYSIQVWDAENEQSVLVNYSIETQWVYQVNLKTGKLYKWSVRGLDINGKQISDYKDKYFFTISEPVNSITAETVTDETFKKTGNTLVLPVSFSDSGFNQGWREKVEKKFQGMLSNFQIMSKNDKEVSEEFSYDIAPVSALSNPVAHYGKDSGNLRDVGDFKSEWEGMYAMKQDSLKLLLEKGIEVKDYHRIVFVVAGAAGNQIGSDQLWPCSVEGRPSDVKLDSHAGKVRGNYKTGIICPIDQDAGVWAHEFGHQLGLVDLYPYPSVPDRNAGICALMGKGTWCAGATCMTGLSRKKVTVGSFKKKNWMGEHIKTVTESGEYLLNARDSNTGNLLLTISMPTGNIGVEVFDKKGLDKNILYKVQTGFQQKSPTRGVIMYYMDSDDVFKIKKMYSYPTTGDDYQKCFLDGGSLQLSGLEIKVDSISEVNGRAQAKILVTMDPEKMKKKTGFFLW